MLRRRTSRTALYERLIAEKDAQIALLQSMLPYGGQPTYRTALPMTATADGLPAELGSATWDTELDEATDILNSNGLSQVHLAEILDGLGVGSSDLS